MNPLLRYTIGKVSKAGWDILYESIRMIRKIYPEFDVAVCYNNLSEQDKLRLRNFDVELHDQDSINPGFRFIEKDDGRVRNFAWKIIPGRLRPSTHELWVDNDIVIRNRFPCLDRWLESNTGIISRGFNKDYGVFTDDMHLMAKEACCAGFFGLPPHYDLDKTIHEVIGDYEMEGFDEQGFIAKVVTDIEGYILIPRREIALLSEYWRPRADFWFPPAIHFARANRFENHMAWRAYKSVVMP